ncbi:MAG: putative transposase [Gaiellales bacterium]|nr:putative transposase [Gaiellales bacterium]
MRVTGRRDGDDPDGVLGHVATLTRYGSAVTAARVSTIKEGYPERKLPTQHLAPFSAKKEDAGRERRGYMGLDPCGGVVGLVSSRRRAEKALISVVADLYLAGVSTRRVEKAIGQLGIESISKSQVSRLCSELDETVEAFRTRPLDSSPYPFVMLDALVVKVREQVRIVNVCVVHATASTVRATARAWASTSSPKKTALKRHGFGGGCDVWKERSELWRRHTRGSGAIRGGGAGCAAGS